MKNTLNAVALQHC